MIAIVLAAVLFGCAKTPTETEPVTTEPEKTKEPVETKTEEPVKAAEEKPEVKEPVTLRYANWNLGTEEENNLAKANDQSLHGFEPACDNRDRGYVR